MRGSGPRPGQGNGEAVTLGGGVGLLPCRELLPEAGAMCQGYFAGAGL